MAAVQSKCKVTALDVAKYFLCLQDRESGDLISNLKLQKLVYYAQGFHLAFYGKPLFAEPIEAWTHGPVVRTVYDRYKKHGDRNIPAPDACDLSMFDAGTKELLNEVYRVMGQYSAWKLREMTHTEPPWKNAYARGNGSVISHQDMAEYLKAFVEKTQ